MAGGVLSSLFNRVYLGGGKRVFDVTAASVGLAACAPALVLIALLVKRDDPGPLFYRGVRAGRNGVPFRIFKFRTMVVDAERGSPTTAKDDQRVTAIGRVLRRSKLDELPQLLNVLVGDMSFVGPRPEVLKYAGMYDDEERCILDVRPGITDLASIEYIDLAEVVGAVDPETYYREHVFKKKNALRVRYVREQSAEGDARILFATILKVAGRALSALPWRR